MAPYGDATATLRVVRITMESELDLMERTATSDKLNLQEQVTALKRQLAEAQKLTALGELVGTTTHEFNNVLMTMINYAKMAMRNRDDATRDKALAKILAAAERAAKITNGILAMARNRADSFEPTDLGQLVDDSLLLLEREMRKYRIRVEKRFEPAPKVMANGNQIQQILLNLLINARQAMPGGGHVMVKLGYDAASHTVDLVVRDTGCGMTPETMRHIFDAFYSTKNGPDASGKGGSGLGLFACRDIVESHHGRIRVESSVGKGTAFTIKLPAAGPAVGAAPCETPAATTDMARPATH